MNELKKVLIVDGMSNDGMIIITDASEEDIEKWCRNYLLKLENGENTYFNSLTENNYVRVLYDSELNNLDELEVIGYDEIYNLSDFT